MGRDASAIVADIRSFEPTDDDNWLALEESLADLFAGDVSDDAVVALLGLFERFRDEDGHGVFWSIVHGLEAVDGYEGRLVESVRRAPTDFSLTMVNRLLNADVDVVRGVRLLDVLKEIAADSATPPRTRATAERFVRHQTDKGR